MALHVLCNRNSTSPARSRLAIVGKYIALGILETFAWGAECGEWRVSFFLSLSSLRVITDGIALTNGH